MPVEEYIIGFVSLLFNIWVWVTVTVISVTDMIFNWITFYAGKKGKKRSNQTRASIPMHGSR